MGPIQLGLPLLTTLPKNWPTIIIDTKDCFFSILLHPEDTFRFAFTVPSINHAHPDQRCEWTVLPQGMTNSPTICQIFVWTTIKPLQEQNPDLIIYHYMDDVLLAHPDGDRLKALYEELTILLEYRGLHIATEKVQLGKKDHCYGSIVLTPQLRF